jgi:hypothetical protein
MPVLTCSIFAFVHFGAQHPQPSASNADDYNEECRNEGCNTEELVELYESYESECREESCDVEEVRELAGRRDAINDMLNAFRARGWTVSNCDFIGNCAYAPGDNVASGDVTFGAMCNQSSINQHWGDFDFDKGDWDEGFGWDAPCNINQPLGRTFNALNLLDFFGTSKPDDSNNWLPWFYAFSSGAIDELDGRCGSGSASGCTIATTRHGPIIDNWTQLYWPFFYGQNVVGRAGTIVHEARHADGSSHNGGTGCPRAGSCDTNWGYNGANTFEVLYLWWVRAQGAGLSPGMRSNAQTAGNQVLANGFNTRPTNAAVFGAGAPNPTAAFSIP